MGGGPPRRKAENKGGVAGRVGRKSRGKSSRRKSWGAPAAPSPDSTDGKDDGLILRGVRYGSRGDTAKAMRCFRRVLARCPDHFDANYNMGNCMLDMGRAREALGYFEKLAGLSPDEPNAHYGVGRALLEANKFKEATTALGRAVKLDPLFMNARNYMGDALGAMGRTRDAIREYRIIMSGQGGGRGGDKERCRATYMMGVTLIADGDTEGAIRYLKKAVAMDPDQPGPYSSLGAAYGSMGMFGKAIKYYKKSSKIVPDDPRPYANIASMLLAAGKNDAALRYVDKSISVDPRYAFAHSVRARILSAAGRAQEGEASMRRAIKLDGRFAKDPVGSHLSGIEALRSGFPADPVD